MNRLGLLAPDSLSGEQKDLYDKMAEYTTTKYGSSFFTRLEDGRFVGPFAVQLHTPEVGQAWIGMAKGLAKIPGLSHRNREIAILVVGAHTAAAYEVYAHEKLSGLPREDLDLIKRGYCPTSFSAEEQIVFKTANALFDCGPLSKGTWEEATKAIGVSGATAVIQYVAFYKYVATILNGFDVQLPEVGSNVDL